MELKSDLTGLIGTDYPIVIAGPCSAESEDQLLSTAHSLRAEGVKMLRAGLWKPRTKPGCFEGVGESGIPWMLRARRETGMKISAEAGSAWHARVLLDADFDALWIGARTTANPFAVQEIADAIASSGKRIAVFVKNPVNFDLNLWIGALQRIALCGVSTYAAVHRGFSSYGNSQYRNPPHWSIPIELRRRYPNLPLLCDPSHICGRRDLIGILSQESIDLGFDGLMIESHIKPSEALSDSDQQLTPQSLGEMLRGLKIRNKGGQLPRLEALRHKIDECDAELLDVLSRRMEVCREIGELKKEQNLPAVHMERHDSIMRSRVEQGISRGLSGDFVSRLMRAVHAESVRAQIEILNRK